MATPFEEFVNAELPNRQVLLKGSGAPTMIATQGSYYVDTATDNRWEKLGNTIDNNWVILSLGGTIVDKATSLIEELDCYAEMVVGDIVFLSITHDDFVETVENNINFRPAVGICMEKPESTRAIVRYFGKSSTIYTNFIKGEPIFIQADGSLGPEVPLTGHIQQLGIARSNAILLLNPQNVLRRA